MRFPTVPLPRGWYLGVECSQHWWHLRSWRRRPSANNLLRFRTFPNGFALGPMMFWRR